MGRQVKIDCLSIQDTAAEPPRTAADPGWIVELDNRGLRKILRGGERAGKKNP